MSTWARDVLPSLIDTNRVSMAMAVTFVAVATKAVTWLAAPW